VVAKWDQLRGMMAMYCNDSSRSTISTALTAILLLGFGSNAAAETRSFVVNWFHLATYQDEGDCPDGLNPDSEKLVQQLLAQAGWSAQDIQKAQTQGAERNAADSRIAMMMRGHNADGTPASAWHDPTSVPDPHIKTVKGKYAIGFDLDGKVDTGGFVEPETGAVGVDNQLYRALGCFIGYHTRLPGRPAYETSNWDWSRGMPVWLVSISGDDLDKDGDVTVTFDLALHTGERNAKGDYIADQTFVLSTNRRYHHVARGRIEQGTLTVKQPFELLLRADGSILPELDLVQGQLRLDVKDWRAPAGFIGGYTPWLTYWFMYQQNAGAIEASESINIPGTYYTFRRFADAEPDPDTGQNQRISAAFRIELTPAMLASSSLGTYSASASRLKK